MTMLTVGDVMTPSPHTINEERSLADAHEQMRKFNVRHLPVLVRGKLVGLLSDRDLNLVETFRDVKPEAVKVTEAMASDPYVVEKNTPLAQVAKGMADHKMGSAIVRDGDKVVGIFTTVDACRVLSTMLAKAN